MFFHANETPSYQDPTPAAKKSPLFFYANGVQEDVPGQNLNSPSPPLSAVSARSGKSQFFRANGSAEDLPPVPPIPNLTSSPSLHQAPSPFQNMPGFRPPSPAKDNFHLSYRKGASQIIRPDNRPKAISILPPASFSVPRQRSTSAESNKFHTRTSSLSSIESVNSTRGPSLAALNTCGLIPLQGLITDGPTSNPQSYSSAPPTAQMASPVLEAETPMNGDATNVIAPNIRSRQASTTSNTFSVPQSPTKTSSGLPPQNLAQLTELAANARRERKVLDLEISNSSLLAINRQLEREVKKQKTEIRRFRRLSRAGRLSSLSFLPSQIDEETPEGLALEPLSELDDFDSESEDEDDESTSDSSSAESSTMSPSVLAEKDKKKLSKDSKRLQLDLHKHRELLVDSQKMNQSLKRCTAWTEEMIAEGKRALEYQVRVSDVKLGGRVLERGDVHPEEEEADAGEGDYSLLGPWSPSPLAELEDGMLGLGLNVDLGRKSWQSEEADSGIEVDSARGSRGLPDGFDVSFRPEVKDLVADLPVCGVVPLDGEPS
jgi:hypothetical protein